MPVLCRTLEVEHEPDGLSDLMERHRIYPDHAEDCWPEDRQVLGECVILQDARAVGFGRIVWDAHTEDMPKVIDVALAGHCWSDFFLDSLEQELIAEYAQEAEGGEFIQGHDGRVIDITRILGREGRQAVYAGSRRPRA